MKSSTNTKPTFGAVVADLTRGGFSASDLLPIIPPGAKLASNTSVKEHQVGKIPGRYRGGVWFGLSGHWPTLGLSEADIERAKSWPTQNVGLRAGAYPGIDIDTDSVEALDLVEGILKSRFGDRPPVRFRGDAPRALYAFRLDPGSDPIRKHRIEWQDGDGRNHAVEVLGLGQQYVIAGIHPSGVAYEWRERYDPTAEKMVPGDLASVTSDGLPTLTVNDVMEVMREIQEAVEARGWTVQRAIAPRYKDSSYGRSVDLSKAEPILDTKTALDALNAIPNDAETIPTRDGLVALLASFKQALGREAENVRAEVLEWATRYGWADEEYFDKIWDSLTSSRVPVDYLISMARKFGWRGDAALDFKDFGQVDEDSDARDSAGDKRPRRVADDPVEVLARKLVYIDTEQLFIVKATGDIYSPEALNCAPHLGATVAEPGTGGKNSPANRLRQSSTPMQIVKGIVYLPGEPTLTNWTRNGRTDLFYNRWHARVFPVFDSVTDDDIRPWLDHVAYIVPDEAEREVLLDFFAHVLQKRGAKIRWAPLIIGKQGTGKDLMIKPIVNYLAHNARDVRPEQLTARFNDFLESELLVVQELKRSITQANSTYNRIKTLIASTANEVNYIERKFQTPYPIPNVVNWVFFSNHFDAIEIEDDDRRFLVIASDVEKRDPEYYRALAVDFYQKESGWLKVASWLLKRDLSGFNPAEPPMQTEGKALLIDAQRPAISRAVEELVTVGVYKHRNALTAEEVVKLGQSNAAVMPEVQRKDITTAAVFHELKRLGWTNHGVVKIKGRLLRFWVRPGTNPTNDDIRKEYEAHHVDVDADTEFAF